MLLTHLDHGAGVDRFSFYVGAGQTGSAGGFNDDFVLIRQAIPLVHVDLQRTN